MGTTTLSDVPAHHATLAESIPWNRFRGSLNIYKFGLSISTWAKKIWKVPSHQIKSTWKWYCMVLMNSRIANGEQIFKCRLCFLILFLVISAELQNMIYVACIFATHAKWSKGWPIIFCNSTKNNLSPLSKSPKGNWAPHEKSWNFGRNYMLYSINLRQFA